MPSTEEAIAVYRGLAEEHARMDRTQERDRFLLLAADAALSAGRREEADRLRGLLLKQNPNHLLKPYPNLSEALKSPDIYAYVQQLRRSFPPDKAETLLREIKGKSQASSGRGAAKDEFVLPLDALRKEEPPPPIVTMDPSGTKPVRAKETETMPDPREPPKPSIPGSPAGWRAQPQAPAPTPAPSPGIFSLKPEEPARPRPTFTPPPLPMETLQPGPSPGAWVSSILFVILLAIAIALAGYVLVIPFVGL